LSDSDPTDHEAATIAGTHHPDSVGDTEKPVIDETPLAPGSVDADGYCKIGPGPIAALRFRWTVNRGEDGQYYVQETIGECSAPIKDGPMTDEAAVKLVDERARRAHERFETLRKEILERSPTTELVQDNSAES